MLSLYQLFCKHKAELTRVVPAKDSQPGRMFTECIACGKQSAGVVLGRIAQADGTDKAYGHVFNRQHTRNARTWLKPVQAKSAVAR